VFLGDLALPGQKFVFQLSTKVVTASAIIPAEVFHLLTSGAPDGIDPRRFGARWIAPDWRFVGSESMLLKKSIKPI
jgi:hypothetical protein